MGSSWDCSGGIDGYNLNWRIIYPALSFLNPDELIHSPEFSTSFMSTEWMFFLRHCLPEGYMSIYLQRNFDNGPASVRVHLKDMKLWKYIDCAIIPQQGLLKFTYEKGDAYELFKIPYFHEEIVLGALNPSKDNLIVCCRLCPDTSVFNTEDLCNLSQNMKALFLHPEFYDTTFCVNGREIKIHRAIFEARANGMRIKGKRKHDDEILHVPIRNARESAVHNLLNFLYSAQIDTDLEVSQESVAATAKELGVPNFESKISLGLSDWTATTVLKSKRKSIRLNIDRTKADNDHTRTFWAGDVEWCFKSHFSNSSTEENVSVNLSTTKAISGVQLNIRFLVVMQSFCGSDLASRIAYTSLKRTDTGRKSLNLELKFEKGDDNSVMTLSLVRFLIVSMEIWNGKTNLVPKAKLTTPNKILNGVNLSADLLQLFETESGADATIIVPDGKFRVHKGILSARSFVFLRMFKTNMKERASNEVVIEDFGKCIMSKFLAYIYSAQLFLDDTEEAIQLAFAADKYALMGLRKKCLQYLKYSFTKDTILDIYVTFDLLRCEQLKEELKNDIRYLYRRCPNEYFEQFKQKTPHLYKEVFQNTISSGLNFKKIRLTK